MNIKSVFQAVINPLRSRKVRVAIATAVCAYLAEKGIDASQDVVYAIIGLGVAVVLGIAIEDNGSKASGNGEGSQNGNLPSGSDAGEAKP